MWNGPAAGTEDVVVPWMVIDGPESARTFADALIGPPQRAFGRNAIGSALLTGKRLIESNDFDGWRKVIDFSGDLSEQFQWPADCRRTGRGSGRRDHHQRVADHVP